MNTIGNIASWQGVRLTIGAEHILRVQGYRARRQARPAIVQAAERAAERAAGLAMPEARAVRVPIVACSGASLELAGGFSFACPVFGEVLAHCDQAAIFVLTLGPDLEAEVAERQAASELLDAYLLDAAGWLMVEQASHRLRAHLSRMLGEEGRVMTARLGPGYDYRDGAGRTRWPLDQQGELFRVFGGAELPVTLLESSAMMPRMSRSGLYGIAWRCG